MAGGTPGQGEGGVVGGRYRLLRALGVGGVGGVRGTVGAGGAGRVWLAYDEELACEVVVKEISGRGLRDVLGVRDVPGGQGARGVQGGRYAGRRVGGLGERAQRITRARGEARHAARLRGHPHVVTVHDVVIHDGVPWIVMEYVPDGVDLQAVLWRSGPLPPAQVARIGLAVLDALTAGHRVGILHRDVKPANILLAPDTSGDPYARVLLTGYGIALRPESPNPDPPPRRASSARLATSPRSGPAASRPPRRRIYSPSARRSTPRLRGGGRSIAGTISLRSRRCLGGADAHCPRG